MSSSDASTASQTSDQPLAGVKVLDLSRFIAGPFCSMLLADMGADVVKVERPSGEDARDMAPFYAGESAYILHFNRNKRGITLDTRAERGRELLAELIGWADVVVENYRPGTMEAMGFGYERIRELDPRTILTSVSGFGQTGPLRERALFDAIAQARSGLMGRTGDPDGDPVVAGTYVADHTAGLFAAVGTLTALFHRERTGAGQHVDVALMDSLFATMGLAVPSALLLGQTPPRLGNRDMLSAPANLFATSDGHVYVHAGTNALFKRLCALIGRPEAAGDERFATIEARMANVDAVERLVGDWTAGLTTAAAVAGLEEAGIPVGAVADVAEAANSEQLRAREMVVEVEHDALGPLSVAGIPVKLSESPGAIRRAAPTLGEHTESVLAEICGLDGEQLALLRADGVV
jgi:crotonobetainyl-CoA:carnitine CoA-transferase CaiB-like acyl-CoA transferase